MGALEEVHRKYKDRAAFYLVYIREGHPEDGWQVPANIRDEVVVSEPKTDDDRHAVAGTCVRSLKIPFPTLIDGMDNAVEKAYAGWPDRLYIVGKDGRVAFKGRPGPAGFRVGEMAEALEKLLAGAK